MRKIFYLLISILLSATALATPPNVTEYTLPNGLKLFVKPIHRAPIELTQVWYKVGSSYEPNGLTGISHALEHMMFEGTKKFPDGQFSAIVKKHGGSLNAFTADDYTAYFETLPAKYLDLSLELESDRMQHLIINKKRFAKEIEVVKEERRMRTENNPQAYLRERFNAAAYVASPYHHPVVGWMDDLNNMTAADLKRWYDGWYMPNNAIIVVVGDVVPEQVYKSVKRYFGKIKNRKVTHIIPGASVKPLGIRTVNVSLPAKLPTLMMAYNVPVIKTAAQHWQPYALEVLAAVLDVGESSRMSKNLVRGQQVVAGIDLSYDIYSRLNSLFNIAAVPAKEHSVREVKEAVLAQIAELKQHPVPVDELARAKAQLIAQQVYGQDDLSAQAYMIGSLEAVGLPWNLSDQYIESIQAINAQQVQEVAKQYLTDQRLTVGILHPLPMTVDDVKKQLRAKEAVHGVQ